MPNLANNNERIEEMMSKFSIKKKTLDEEDIKKIASTFFSDNEKFMKNNFWQSCLYFYMNTVFHSKIENRSPKQQPGYIQYCETEIRNLNKLFEEDPESDLIETIQKKKEKIDKNVKHHEWYANYSAEPLYFHLNEIHYKVLQVIHNNFDLNQHGTSKIVGHALERYMISIFLLTLFFRTAKLSSTILTFDKNSKVDADNIYASILGLDNTYTSISSPIFSYLDFIQIVRARLSIQDNHSQLVADTINKTYKAINNAEYRKPIGTSTLNFDYINDALNKRFGTSLVQSFYVKTQNANKENTKFYTDNKFPVTFPLLSMLDDFKNITCDKPFESNDIDFSNQNVMRFKYLFTEVLYKDNKKYFDVGTIDEIFKKHKDDYNEILENHEKGCKELAVTHGVKRLIKDKIANHKIQKNLSGSEKNALIEAVTRTIFFSNKKNIRADKHWLDWLSRIDPEYDKNVATPVKKYLNQIQKINESSGVKA